MNELCGALIMKIIKYLKKNLVWNSFVTVECFLSFINILFFMSFRTKNRLPKKNLVNQYFIHFWILFTFLLNSLTARVTEISKVKTLKFKKGEILTIIHLFMVKDMDLMFPRDMIMVLTDGSKKQAMKDNGLWHITVCVIQKVSSSLKEKLCLIPFLVGFIQVRCWKWDSVKLINMN